MISSIYGVLHSPEYKETFKNNLTKELPRIPIVENFDVFLKFSESGKKLSDLHVNYEQVEKYPIQIKQGDLRLTYINDEKEHFRCEQMKFISKKDKSTVFYNKYITIEHIPIEAFDYVVNRKK